MKHKIVIAGPASGRLIEAYVDDGPGRADGHRASFYRKLMAKTRPPETDTLVQAHIKLPTPPKPVTARMILS